jgi:hypothetical protein
MSAAMALHNATRSRDISEQLQAQRQAQLEEQQLRTGEEATRYGEEQELRNAMKALPEDATTDQYMKTYMRYGDPSRGIPWLRTEASMKGRMNIQNLKALDNQLRQARDKGATADQQEAIARSFKDEQGNPLVDDDTVLSLRSMGILPAVHEGIEKTRAQTNLSNVTAENIPIRTTEMIRHDEETERLKSEAISKIQLGGVLKPAEEHAIRVELDNLNGKIAALSGKTRARDPLTYKFAVLTDDEKKSMQGWKDQIEQLEGILERNEQLKKSKVGAGVAPQSATEPAEDESDPLGYFSKPK